MENCDLKVDGTTLLSKLSMSLSSGEVVSLIGSNGAGKTSLLKSLCGDYKLTTGHVTLDGKPLNSIELDVKARRFAVLPQRSGLDFPFLVHEVIEMGRYPQMTGRSLDRQIVADVIEQLGLGSFEYRRYTTLSGGERQRVQIGRVLAQLWDRQHDACYLFDEPTAPLDLAHQLEFFALIRSLANNGAAVLLVIHDLNLAARFSDRLIMLKQGKILAEGTPEEVITQNNLKSGFDVEVHITPATADRSVQISY